MDRIDYFVGQLINGIMATRVQSQTTIADMVDIIDNNSSKIIRLAKTLDKELGPEKAAKVEDVTPKPLTSVIGGIDMGNL